MKSKAHSKKCMEMGVPELLIEDQDAEDSGTVGKKRQNIDICTYICLTSCSRWKKLIFLRKSEDVQQIHQARGGRHGRGAKSHNLRHGNRGNIRQHLKCTFKYVSGGDYHPQCLLQTHSQGQREQPSAETRRSWERPDLHVMECFWDAWRGRRIRGGQLPQKICASFSKMSGRTSQLSAFKKLWKEEELMQSWRQTGSRSKCWETSPPSVLLLQCNQSGRNVSLTSVLLDFIQQDLTGLLSNDPGWRTSPSQLELWCYVTHSFVVL